MEQKKEEIIKWLLNPDNPEAYIGLTLEEGERRIKKFGLEKILQEIELPLVGVLEKMLEQGVALDIIFLEKLKVELDGKLKVLVKKIYEEAGSEFNINSPKQLAEILFSRLKISPRLNSTAADKLAIIKDKHPIIASVLDYRESFKLKNTYVAPLLGCGSEVHTTFVQTGTATGRLSSQNPNLQNIPEAIKPAFVARLGYQLASFDYSQIELRVMASVAGDQKMMEAFKKNIDIHQLTASRVFKLPLEEVTAPMRQLAKTLNFGVIYGMGAAAFAKVSGLGRKEAAEFIRNYFETFSEIKKWQEMIIEKARETGYVENLNGRKRWLPNINSQDRFLAAGAERAAINMPIQSLAADIIKLAMLKAKQYRLLLSIHDELLFELENDKLKEQIADIKQIMEGVYLLAVPLKVNVKVGGNWGGLVAV